MFLTLKLRFLEIGGRGFGARILCQRAGGSLLLIYSEMRWEGVQKSENIADTICERSLTQKLIKDVKDK